MYILLLFSAASEIVFRSPLSAKGTLTIARLNLAYTLY
jgi:hypothetical protein